MHHNYFIQMIRNLREQEEILLYGYVMEMPETEVGEVVAYLREEFEREALEYPLVPPAFDPEAAAWGAKVVYIAAQLILYRKNQEAELSSLIPDFTQEPTAGRILSADLCLRFLPDMLLNPGIWQFKLLLFSSLSLPSQICKVRQSREEGAAS